MSAETERENLAEAEAWLARIVDGFRPPMETSMDKAAAIQNEYDRRGEEIDWLKYRLECETSFTAAHQASALKWAALVAEQKDDIEQARTERDEALGLLSSFVAAWNLFGAEEEPPPEWVHDVAERARALVKRVDRKNFERSQSED